MGLGAAFGAGAAIGHIAVGDRVVDDGHRGATVSIGDTAVAAPGFGLDCGTVNGGDRSAGGEGARRRRAADRLGSAPDRQDRDLRRKAAH